MCIKMSEIPSEKSTLAVAQEQVRLARLDLEKWQAAYDSYCGEDARKFHAEIRTAEERLRRARAMLRDLRKKVRL
jgi:hypothetical protein